MFNSPFLILSHQFGPQNNNTIFIKNHKQLPDFLAMAQIILPFFQLQLIRDLDISIYWGKPSDA